MLHIPQQSLLSPIPILHLARLVSRHLPALVVLEKQKMHKKERGLYALKISFDTYYFIFILQYVYFIMNPYK